MRIYDSSMLNSDLRKIVLHAQLPQKSACSLCDQRGGLRVVTQHIEYERHAEHGDIAVIDERTYCVDCGGWRSYRYIVSLSEQARTLK